MLIHTLRASYYHVKATKKYYITNDKIGKDYPIITNIESSNKNYLHSNKLDEYELAYLKASFELLNIRK